MTGVAPCDWPLIYCGDSETGEPECSHLASLSPDVQQAITESAVAFLWNATGNKFGLCEVTVRPCSQTCNGSTYQGWSGAPAGGIWGWGGGWGYGWGPYYYGGQWYNWGCGGCGGSSCDSSHMDSIRLPGPVNGVLEVTINGDVFTDWVSDNWGLSRTDGSQWPRQQDMSAPLSDPNTWGVTYLRGIPVPLGGQLAAGKLACELARFQCGDGTCQLPKRVATIVREGVTVAFQDDFAALQSQAGPLTGIWAIDQWISSINYSARKRGRVLTPSTRATRQVRPTESS